MKLIQNNTEFLDAFSIIERYRNKAKESCKNASISVLDHFANVSKTVKQAWE